MGDRITLEFSVHRIGGPENHERTWGPWLHDIHLAPVDEQTVQLQGARWHAESLRVRLYRIEPAMSGWWSAQLSLQGPQGSPVGHERPALFYERPSDVPTYTAVVGWDESVYSVGIRRTGFWQPAKPGDDR